MAGVLFAVLFGTSLILIHGALPEGAAPGSQWLDAGSLRLKTASILMPFAGICFLWFIGVVRDGLGHYEDRFFATVFFGSGLLFLAMMFASAAVGAGLVESRHYAGGAITDSSVGVFGQMLLLKLSKTYALRMAGVFMMSLATIWLRLSCMVCMAAMSCEVSSLPSKPARRSTRTVRSPSADCMPLVLSSIRLAYVPTTTVCPPVAAL